MIATDILAPNLTSDVGMEALAAAITTCLTPEEREQFIADLDLWNARFAAVMEELAHSPEWQEIEQWRAYILAGGATGAPGSI